jgi:formylmethanofuran dehydrogenase subunit E
MRCSVCGRPAWVSIEESGTERSLCLRCAERFGPGPWIIGLLAKTAPGRPTLGRCPNCGTTEAEVRQTGLVGCALCYEAMEPGTLAAAGASWEA